jgi:acyl carrier protein
MAGRDRAIAMTEAEIYLAMGQIFAEVFRRADIVMSAQLSARDVAGWDSFKQVEIIMATEDKFDIQFTTAELDGLKNLGDLVRVIAARGMP